MLLARSHEVQGHAIERKGSRGGEPSHFLFIAWRRRDSRKARGSGRGNVARGMPGCLILVSKKGKGGEKGAVGMRSRRHQGYFFWH